MFKRIGLVVNPASGRKNQRKWLRKIYPMFENSVGEVKVCFTENPGDGIRRARELADEGYEVVVSVGGDGTLNEVVNGIAGTKSVLGIIPLGSGNVFARENGIPLDPVSAAKLIIEDGKVKKIDVGEADGRYFLMLLSCGYDAYSVYKVEVFHRDAKNFLGRLSFIVVGARTLFKYKYHKIKAFINGGNVHDEGSIVVVSNTSSYGMPFIKINPDAVPVDGELNIAVIKIKSWSDTVGFAFRLVLSGLFNKELLPENKISRYRAKKVKLVSDGRVYIQTDGEIHKTLPAEVIVHPQFLPVILPE